MKRLSIAVILMLLLAAVASAQPAPHARGAAVLAKYLDLTSDQAAQWKQIHLDTAAAIKPLQQQAQDLQKQLAAAIEAATPDPTAIGKLNLSLHSVRTQIRDARKASEEKLRAVLTDGQKVKFDAFQAAVAFLRAERPRR